MLDKYPYTNFHELNLDWIIEKVKECYSPDNPPDAVVLSVNGETGDVVLYRDAAVQLPTIEANTWAIFRIANGTTTGVQMNKNGNLEHIDGTHRYAIYDANNQPPYPVTSVNGQTGAVVINFPVNSVNGQTGNVVIPIAFDRLNATYLHFDVASTDNEWGLERGILNGGNTGISFEINNGHLEAYLNYLDVNDEVVDRFKILTTNEIPTSEVISINNQTGVVVLTGEDIQVNDTDTTSVAAAIADLRYRMADMAPTWSGSTSYVKGNIVFNSGTLYVATANNAAGTPFAQQSWSAIVLATEVSHKAGQDTLAYAEYTDTASTNISSGQYVFWKGSLYKASANISLGDTLSSSNLSAVSAGGLNDINTALGTLNDQIGSVDYVKNYVKHVTIPGSGSVQISCNGYGCILVGGLLQQVGNIGLYLGMYGSVNAIVKITDGTAWTDTTHFNASWSNGTLTITATVSSTFTIILLVS